VLASVKQKRAREHEEKRSRKKAKVPSIKEKSGNLMIKGTDQALKKLLL
jgi:hypothetical protein